MLAKSVLLFVVVCVPAVTVEGVEAGTVKWSFQTGGPTGVEGSLPAVSKDGATIFVGSNDKKVYALDAVTGAKKWEFATGSWVYSSPAVSNDGATIFVGSDDNKVYALDAVTGAKKWEFATGNQVRSSPAVSNDGATIFVGSRDTKVYALDAMTGAKKWEFATGSWVWSSSPAVSKDGTTIFVGSFDKNVYALDTVTGAKKWQFTTGDFVYSSPAVSNDGTTIFVGSRDKKVYALDAVTGAKKWEFATGGQVLGSLAVSKHDDGTTIFVSSNDWDYKVYALDAVTGEKEWEFVGPDGSPAVSNDAATIFVGSRDSRVYAVHSGVVLTAYGPQDCKIDYYWSDLSTPPEVSSIVDLCKNCPIGTGRKVEMEADKGCKCNGLPRVLTPVEIEEELDCPTACVGSVCVRVAIY
jgi:outer membrane protein assembly factor BamB